MPILIDGHNLIGQLPTLSLQDPNDEEELVGLLRSYQARTGQAITVVFDPGGAFSVPWSGHAGSIEVLFAPYGSSADASISRRVRKSHNPAGWLVVTSDRALAETVMQAGARVKSSEAFAAELGPRSVASTSQDAPLSPAEVAEWLALFQAQD